MLCAGTIRERGQLDAAAIFSTDGGLMHGHQRQGVLVIRRERTGRKKKEKKNSCRLFAALGTNDFMCRQSKRCNLSFSLLDREALLLRDLCWHDLML